MFKVFWHRRSMQYIEYRSWNPYICVLKQIKTIYKHHERKHQSDVSWEYLEVCEGGERTVPARALDQVDVADDAGANLVVDWTERGVESPENKDLEVNLTYNQCSLLLLIFIIYFVPVECANKCPVHLLGHLVALCGALIRLGNRLLAKDVFTSSE